MKFTKKQREEFISLVKNLIHEIETDTLFFKSYGICGNIVLKVRELPSNGVLKFIADTAQNMSWFSGNTHYPVPAPDDYEAQVEADVFMEVEHLAEHYFEHTDNLYADPDQKRMRLELCRAVLDEIETENKILGEPKC